jgi:hypothetical protein
MMIPYRILNARFAAGAVSAGQGGGMEQAYDGWRVVSQFEFQQMGGGCVKNADALSADGWPAGNFRLDPAAS